MTNPDRPSQSPAEFGANAEAGPRRYAIRTYGCQMNVHDSEKVANLLHHDGWRAASQVSDAELLIINTCSIRDKAEHRLYSELGTLRDWKRERSGRVIGVAGCVAQQQGDALLRRFAHLDFVYGPHNLRRVPAMAEAALGGRRAADTAESSSLERFDLPLPHPDLAGDPAGRAFVTVMEGCDMFCSFCIVPYTRGREISRSADSIVEEVRARVDRGVAEVTLLGQTVNAFGRHALRRAGGAQSDPPDPPTSGPAPVGFAELLARLDAIPGLRRIRYTSPHPTFFDAALIAAHRDLESLCPHVHLPVQAGSDRILERMRRRHTRDEYRALVESLRAARPDLAITTDLIVGFPGETDADFADTLALVRDVGFVDSFSFKYSPRPKTSAADFGDAVSGGVAQSRLEQLQELQRGLTLEAHRRRVGECARVLVEGESRRGGQQLSGHDVYHRTVNFPRPAEAVVGPGSWVDVTLVDATPHSLIGEADGATRPVSATGAVAAESHPALKLAVRNADATVQVNAPGGSD
jgi:tRNA-2-methylthio-N6-dimethylallyladenosine synthase